MRNLILLAATTAFLGSPTFAKDPAPAKKDEAKKETPKKDEAKGKTMHATFTTSMGNFKIKLWPDKAPKTVENFVGLATGKKEWTHPKNGEKMKDKPLYDGTKFHRVIPGFMIQGGDPLGNGTGGPGFQFDDEIHSDNKFNKTGLLAMANAGKDRVTKKGTNGSQFFVTVSEPGHLDPDHTVFGEVVEGYPIVEKISKKGTGGDVVLKSVKIETK